MEFKMVLNSGILKIHGELPGETRVISKCKEELTCVQLPNATLIP